MKMIEVIWQKGVPCELPEQFDPFLINVKGSNALKTIGSLQRPDTYYDDASKTIIEWVAKRYLDYALLENSQDSSECTIVSYISTGNWIIRQLKLEMLDDEAIEHYKPIAKVFQKIAAKTRSDQFNNSTSSEKSNNTIIDHLNIVNNFLRHLFPNNARAIDDHLYHGKSIDSIDEPPSEFCVIETVRHMAKVVKFEESQMNKAISTLEYKLDLNIDDIISIFNSTKKYRYSFLYLFIAVTGINGTSSMLITLEDLDVDNDKKTSGKSVCVYKPRADKVVSFEIPKDFLIKFVNQFVGIFNKFNSFCDELKLDLQFDYIGRQAFDSDGGYKHITQYYLFRGWFKYNARPELTTHLQKRLNHEGITDEIIEIPTPRDLRNYKSTSIESSHGHNMAAIIMQHSTETAFKYYQKRRKKEAIENLGEFYFDFYGFVKNLGEKIERRLTSIPAGECIATDDEKSIIELKTANNAYIAGDCTTPTGCLFCSLFVVHANEEGVYKLISMRQYVLLKNQTLAWRSEFENNYGAIIERINVILQNLKDKLKDKAVEWIIEAERKVAYGLHPVWQELFEMDMALLDVTL